MFCLNFSASLTATAAAKSLQSCPTLCDPIDRSPPGSPVPGILQASTLEWVAISFSNACLTSVQKLFLLRFLMKLRCPNQEQGIFKLSFVFSGIISSGRFLHISCLFLNSVSSLHTFHIIS